MTVQLRAWRSGDEEAAVRWSQDQEFCLANGWTPDLPAPQVRAHWQQRAASSPFMKMIESSDVGESRGVLVGYAEWQDKTDTQAELGIAIGERRVWGQGIGAEAGRQMLAWAFGPLGLARVWAEVHASNARSLALMRRLGFRENGIGGTEEYRGVLVPLVQFELTLEDWNQRAGG